MIIAIAVTKRCAFRDSVQEFSNVYHYQVIVPPNEAEALNRIDELVAIEKTFHSSAVTFVYARCWSAGGTASSNVMIGEKSLSGSGSASTIAWFDQERAYLVQWPNGFDSRGRPKYLRKWYHACGNFGSTAPSNSVLQGSTGFSSAQRTAIASAADDVRFIGTAGEYTLCSPSGVNASSGGSAHPYLEHHQLGEQWRG